jgi:hypothetical protein
VRRSFASPVACDRPALGEDVDESIAEGTSREKLLEHLDVHGAGCLGVPGPEVKEGRGAGPRERRVSAPRGVCPREEDGRPLGPTQQVLDRGVLVALDAGLQLRDVRVRAVSVPSRERLSPDPADQQDPASVGGLRKEVEEPGQNEQRQPVGQQQRVGYARVDGQERHGFSQRGLRPRHGFGRHVGFSLAPFEAPARCDALDGLQASQEPILWSPRRTQCSRGGHRRSRWDGAGLIGPRTPRTRSWSRPWC